MPETLTVTFICTYAILIAAWAIFLVAWMILWQRSLQLAKIEQSLVKFLPCSECLNEFIFILRLLEFFADETRDYQQTFEREEVRIFLYEDLKSAEITIDGKNNWKLVLDKGGESLIKGLWTAGAELTKLDDNGKTILHVAVEQNNEPVVLLLRNLGFNTKAKDSKGKTALDYANEGKMTSMQNLLRELVGTYES